MKNAFTIDVEDWYQTLDFNFDIKDWCNFEDRVENSTETILDLLEKHNTKATFFILGYIAKKHPTLVRKIVTKGHEIGSHGTWHKMVTLQTREEFKKNVLTSKKTIEDITGIGVQLYRSSSWSICQKTLWALEILNELGFICDSSIQPFKTPLSGMKNVSCDPFYPIINNKRLDLIEFPATVLKFWKFRIPFSGGFYLRLIPYSILSKSMKCVNKNRQGMIYVHPWETDVEQPRLKLPLHIRAIHYTNLNKTTFKLDKLLNEFEFVPLGELIKENNYISISLDK